MSLQFWLLGKRHTLQRFAHSTIEGDVCVNQYESDIEAVVLNILTEEHQQIYSRNMGLTRLIDAAEQQQTHDGEASPVRVHRVRAHANLLFTFDRSIRIATGRALLPTSNCTTNSRRVRIVDR